MPNTLDNQSSGSIGRSSIASQKMNLKRDVDLSKFNSLRIGGKAKYFFTATTAEQLQDAIAFALQNGLAAQNSQPYFILGGGTNTFIADKGYNGVLIRNHLRGIAETDGLIVADTGLTLAEINNFAFARGFVGFHKIATVPGTLGGALYSNAHWQDWLISEFVQWVDILEINREANNPVFRVRRVPAKEMKFGYDTSIIKTSSMIENGHIIALRAGIKLPKGDVVAARKELLENLQIRSAHQPYSSFTCGCIFQNVPQKLGPGKHGTSAGYLIEQCGLKGYRIGGAFISDKHCNFIVNDGSAASDDVLRLIEICKNRVREKYGIALELEIKLLLPK